MITLEVASILVFFAVLGILIYRDKKNIEFKYGLVTRRTKKGKKWIYQFAEKHERILQLLGTVGVIVGIGASIYGFYYLLMSTYNVIFRPEQIQQTMTMVLPTVTGVEYPSFAIGVPFWYWIIGIFSVLMAHEPMHGLLARVEKIGIKSFGLILLVVMPGAFVEPDEKQIKKLSMFKKMRIYAAGSLGNFILAAIVAAIIFLFLNPVFYRGAVAYGYLNYTEHNLTEPFPAEKMNMTGTIISMDGINVESMEDLQEVMSDKVPGENILIETTKGEYWLTLTKDPKNETKGYMGIFVGDTNVLKEVYINNSVISPIISSTTELLLWILLLNAGIGTANLLPIKPLDGGLMLEEVVKKFVKKKWVKRIVVGFSLFTLLLMLIALFGPNIVKLLG